MKKILIACINNQYVIGRNNKLIYHVKNDTNNFKRLTKDNVVIMGRKTYESIPNHPLKNRVNIVITSNPQYQEQHPDEKIIIADSIEKAVKLASIQYNDKIAYIIGGASIYDEALRKGLINEIFLTKVDDDSKEADDARINDKLIENSFQEIFSTLPQNENNITFSYHLYKKKL